MWVASTCEQQNLLACEAAKARDVLPGPKGKPLPQGKFAPRRSPDPIVYGALFIAAVVTGWQPQAVAVNCADAAPRTTSDFAAEGPFPVGVTTVTFTDTSRPTPPNGSFAGAAVRTLVTEIWYPATAAGRDAPVNVAGAPYPVVVHSHGFLDNRNGEAYLAQHLASRGFVVAAPDYPLSNGAAPGGATVADVSNQPGDWSFVLDGVLARFGSAADPDRVGASGLSLGGLTTLLVTFHRDLRDTRVKAALPIAPASCFFTGRFFKTTAPPMLVLQGDSDQLVPIRENGRRAYRHAPQPKLEVELRNGSHTGFAGVAVTFDQSQHFDGVGCAALAGRDLTIALPGGTDAGISATDCLMPCREPIPAGPSMGATRQHDLTRVTAAAFFEGYLRDDVSARCFLSRTARREASDIRVRSHGVPGS